MAGRVCVACLRKTWQQDALWEEKQVGEGSLMLWAMFCWETLGAGIHENVTLTRTTDLNIVADHIHHFIAVVFLEDSALFQQSGPATLQKLFRNEEHDNEFKVLLWAPNSPESDWASIGCAGPTHLIHRGPISQLARLKEIAPQKWTFCH